MTKPISKKLTVQNNLKKNKLKIVNKDEETVLGSFLTDNLGKSFPRQAKIPWQQIHKEKLPKKLKREKVRSLKKDFREQQITEKDIDVGRQKHFHLGFNKVVKTLQENKSVCVLVSLNLPEKMLDILLDLCQMRRVSIIGLNSLDQLTKVCLGFSCSVIAFSNISEETFLEDMTRKVIDLAVDDMNKMEVDGDNPYEMKNGHNSNAPSNNVTQIKRKEETKEPRNLHLKRKSKFARAFVVSRSPEVNKHSNGEPKLKRLKTDSPSSIYINTKM